MDPITALTDILTRGGPYVLALVFAWLWLEERKERRSVQDRVYGDKGLYEQGLSALTNNTTVLDSLRDLLVRGGK